MTEYTITFQARGFGCYMITLAAASKAAAIVRACERARIECGSSYKLKDVRVHYGR
jgi:hypothetical protein